MVRLLGCLYHTFTHIQVPSVLVLVSGLVLVLVPVHMSELVLQVTSRCDIPAHHQQYVMAVVSSAIIREAGEPWHQIIQISLFILLSFQAFS